MLDHIKPAVIDMNPVSIKPILFTTYDKSVKYNLTITYEDSTTKTVELVTGDVNRPYKVVFKKEGTLITAIGIPKIVYEITESNKFCDFCNKIMDSNDLLIELDCSAEYACNKVRFYLKDLRDIIDILMENPFSETNFQPDVDTSQYRIYLQDLTCDTVIKYDVSETFVMKLKPSIGKLIRRLSSDEASGVSVFPVNFGASIDIDLNDIITIEINEGHINQELKLIIRYFVNELNHPVFDEFTIIPYIKDETTEEITDVMPVLTRAVTTADMQYLGDGLKPALGIGLTPGYKQYRNSKNYNDSVMTEE